MALRGACRPQAPAHLGDQEEPHQVAHDSNGEDEELTPPALLELPGERVHGSSHQALHTDKLQGREAGMRSWSALGLAQHGPTLAALTMPTHADAQERGKGARPALPSATSPPQRVPAARAGGGRYVLSPRLGAVLDRLGQMAGRRLEGQQERCPHVGRGQA